MKKENILTKDEILEVIDELEIMHPDAACELNYKNNYELIVSVILSAQTTDVSVNKVTPKLFEIYPDAYALSVAKNEDIEELIKNIGLYRSKSKNIIDMAKSLVNEFDGQVPNDFKNLVGLRGVGPKTANVVLAEAFNVPAIAVDTHVFRVSNRIGIVDESDVAHTEKSLKKQIPMQKWIRAHHLLIFHGRRICTARNPKCELCKIKLLCRFYNEV